MAFIPDEAIDRLSELSKGARHLYVFLARCRNQKNGKCCPSVSTTMQSLACNRGTVYALRSELVAANWATFEGDDCKQLFGFGSLKNQTVFVENKEDGELSLKNQTDDAIESENSDNLQAESEKSDSESLNNQTTCLKNQTIQSENSDSHIRKNQQIEPANRTSKEEHAADAACGSASAFNRLIFQAFAATVAELDFDAPPYSPTKADWVQVDALRKRCVKTGWELTPERLKTALDHYRASPLGVRTLADFSSRFSDFYRHAVDRFGKPQRAPASSGHTDKTAGNDAAVEEAIRRMEERIKNASESSGTVLQIT